MTTLKKKQFQKLSAEEEYALITTDDPYFTKTKAHIQPLISHAVERACIDLKTRKTINEAITADISVAVNRFLKNKENKAKGIRFSVYFTWYIAHRINTQGTLKKRGR